MCRGSLFYAHNKALSALRAPLGGKAVSELIEALKEEVRVTLEAGGAVHPNDAFDLAYHAGQLLGMDVDSLERADQ